MSYTVIQIQGVPELVTFAFVVQSCIRPSCR